MALQTGGKDEKSRLRFVVDTGEGVDEPADEIRPAAPRHADVVIARGILFAVRRDDVARVVPAERDTGAYPIETIGVLPGDVRKRGDEFFRFHRPSFCGAAA